MKTEVGLLHDNRERSALRDLLFKKFADAPEGEINLNSLYVPCIAEKALIYLFAEVNLITEQQLKHIVDEIGLDKRYMERTLADNRRPVAFT